MLDRRNIYLDNLRKQFSDEELALHVQIDEMKGLLRETYDQKSLGDLIRKVASCEGLTLLRYSSSQPNQGGGSSAVTPIDLKDEIQAAYNRYGHAFVGKLVAARPGFVLHEHKMIQHLEQSLRSGQLLHQAVGYGSMEEHFRHHPQPKTLTTILERLQTGFSFSSLMGVKPGLESALDGGLIAQWDRDCIMQCLAEMQVRLDPALGEGTRIQPDAWKRGLISCLRHHYRYADRMVEIIKGNQSGYEVAKRPHIRYNAINGDEFDEVWGYGQNDAMTMIGYMYFFALNRKDVNGVRLLEWNDADLYWQDPDGPENTKGAKNHMGARYIALLHHYLRKIHVWEDFDNGSWEEDAAEHASSIGCALGFLREEVEFVKRFGPISAQVGEEQYVVTEESINDLMSLCWNKLMALLPKEFDKSDFGPGQVRENDLAILNAMLLAEYSGIPFINDEYDMQILMGNNYMLMGPYGDARYMKPKPDVWDGRTKRTDFKFGANAMQSTVANWTHGNGQKSFILAGKYLRNRLQRNPNAQLYRDGQDFHFNRDMASLYRYPASGNSKEVWLKAEAIIIDPITRLWTVDRNVPLAWSTGSSVLAFSGEKQSITPEAEYKRLWTFIWE
jgi:hypothetical protein